ncbi:MAG: V-type ATP synthase subunit I [bacterium]
MAVEQLAKVLIAVHKDDREEFLVRLQKAGLMHIAEAAAEAEAQPAAPGQGDDRMTSRRVGGAVEELEARTRKGGLLAGFGSARAVVSRSEFEERGAAYDPLPALDRLAAADRRRSEADGRLKQIAAEESRLGPWQGLAHAPADAQSLRYVRAAYGRFGEAGEVDRFVSSLGGVPCVVNRLGTEAGAVLAEVVAPAADWQRVTDELSKVRFEPVDLRGVAGRPADLLEELVGERAELEARLLELGAEANAVAVELRDLKVAADTLADREVRRTAAERLEQTRSVSAVTGWVRRRDLNRLTRVVREAGPGAIEELVPLPGEQQPVALTNPRVFRPFEMVLELFSLPSGGELDPTVLLAPFFVISFGLCLTDAGYGIIIAVLARLLMRKMGRDNKLLGIIFWGAIFTIPAGAMVGGWFGDLPDRLGLDWLLRFKNTVMWFDPIKDPMKFFILSLVFGYVHMMYGFVIEIADCIRVRNYPAALLGQLPWFLFINCLVAVVAVGGAAPGWLRHALLALALLSVAAIIVFTQQDSAALGRQALWFVIVGSALLVIGRMLGWLPAVFGLAKWSAYAAVLAGYALTGLGLLRSGRPRPVPIVFGAVGLAAVAFNVAGVVPGALALPLSLPFLFVAPTGRKHGVAMAWGAYALYGATGYVGVVLSYIRLMALGMVTGGIAMTVNVIAWMVLDVPVVGIVLAVIVLAGGHAYNIAVNVLGAFVHTLRLNYVEFFPRFYNGGGEPFRPFREEHQYTAVK